MRNFFALWQTYFRHPLEAGVDLTCSTQDPDLGMTEHNHPKQLGAMNFSQLIVVATKTKELENCASPSVKSVQIVSLFKNYSPDLIFKDLVTIFRTRYV